MCVLLSEQWAQQLGRLGRMEVEQVDMFRYWSGHLLFYLLHPLQWNYSDSLIVKKGEKEKVIIIIILSNGRYKLHIDMEL